MTRLWGLYVSLVLAGPALAADADVAKSGKSTAAEKKFCENSTPQEIIESYGRIWGQRAGGISGKESEVIEDQLIDLHLCRAISDKRLATCSPLAKLSYRGAQEETLAGRCMREFYRLGFDEFLAGGGAAGACQAFIQDLGVDQRPGFSTADICGALRNRGNKPVCSVFAARGLGDADCRESMPFSAKDCQGNSSCLGRWELYQAVTKRSAAGCPGYLRFACRNWIAGLPAECAQAEARLRRTYCKLYAQAYKRTKGQLGLSQQQLEDIERTNRNIRDQLDSRE